MLIIERDSLLSSYEHEAFTKLKQEFLYMIYQGILQICFHHWLIFRKAYELENIRILEDILGASISWPFSASLLTSSLFSFPRESRSRSYSDETSCRLSSLTDHLEAMHSFS